MSYHRGGVGLAMYDSAPMTTSLKSAGMPGVAYGASANRKFPQQEAAFDSESQSVQRSPPKPIEIRKEFPETWLFDHLEFSK